MKFVNIVCIYKGKGDKMDLKNERGIFMKMVWSEVYETIPILVAVKRRTSGIMYSSLMELHINDVINGNAEPIDVEIIDYRQCFDSMWQPLWLSENINDLFESGVTDDNLALIHEANAENLVALIK